MVRKQTFIQPWRLFIDAVWGKKKYTQMLFHIDKAQIKRGCIALAQSVGSCDYSSLYALCCAAPLL